MIAINPKPNIFYSSKEYIATVTDADTLADGFYGTVILNKATPFTLTMGAFANNNERTVKFINTGAGAVTLSDGSTIIILAQWESCFLLCDGIDWYAFEIHNIHNDLTGLQGGQAGQYNHMTDAQIAALHAQSHVLLSADHTDTLPDTVVAGDILIGNATPKWARLAKGTEGYALVMGASLPAWASLSDLDLDLNTDFLKAVKGTQSLTNIVTNGNFANGTTGWTNLGTSVLSASNNILSCTGNGASAQPDVYQDTGYAISANKKIYARAYVKVTNAVCSLIRFQGYTTGFGNYFGETTVSNPTQNIIYPLSIVFDTGAVASGNFTLFTKHVYADAATANGKVMEVQNVIVIDLTAKFGTGNEPTASQMDTMIDNYFSGWFDSTKYSGASYANKFQYMTSAEVAAAVTDETGTGALVFGTSPTFTTQITTPKINLTGGQIAFPAAQNASADANTLDDYEEGTWTATFSPNVSGSITLTANTGYYTKIGKEVTLTGYFPVASVSSPVGALVVSGIPFTPAYYSAITIYGHNLVNTAITALSGYASTGGYLIIYKYSAGSVGDLSGDIQAGTDIMIKATYFV